MSNWTQVVQADISGAKTGQYVTSALSAGFDLPGQIADVIARIRSAVSAGNALDLDPTKIPNTLKGLAIRMVVRRVKDFLDQTPTALEVEDMKADNSYILRIVDEKLKFEQPDTPAGSAEMQPPAPIEFQRHRPAANYGNLHGLT